MIKATHIKAPIAILIIPNARGLGYSDFDPVGCSELLTLASITIENGQYTGIIPRRAIPDHAIELVRAGRWVDMADVNKYGTANEEGIVDAFCE